jgi:PAS domain S-box-containing protein
MKLKITANSVALIFKTGWHSSDASSRDIEDVFPIFSETSRLPMDNPVRPALLESRLVTCPHDTLWQRRDGTCLPIDSSATPIRSSRGETAGAVLIFRDITERRLVETEVQRYQNHLGELVTERTMEIQHTNRRLLAEVEDEAAVNRLVRTALTQNGYTVTTASGVKEALALFNKAEGNFDMIFSDAVLPDGNGVPLPDIFLSRNPNLRALLSSGYTDRDSLMQRARQRRISFLPKPSTLPTLFHTVADVIKDQNTHLLV